MFWENIGRTMTKDFRMTYATNLGKDEFRLEQVNRRLQKGGDQKN